MYIVLLDSIVVQYVSIAHVRNIITSLKESSPGYDYFSPFVIKHMLIDYIEHIPVLINNSFYYGIFLTN